MKSKFITLYVFIMMLSSTALSHDITLVSIPSHPSKLHFDSLKWSIPMGDPYRSVLKNGLRAYVATDSSLPLVQISGYIKYGSLLDPAEKKGLASLVATMMRSGGTTKYPADTLDKIIDQMAMNFSISADESSLHFSASFLSDYTDKALDILQQVLFYPVFDQKKLDKKKSLYVEGIRHRFDNPSPTLEAAYQKIMYPNTPASLLSTEQSINAITRDDLVRMHKKYVLTRNIIFSIAGPFSRSAMLTQIEKLFPDNGLPTDTTFPSIECKPLLKSLIINKQISQAYVKIGLPLFKRPNPDYYPVSVLNMIFGGGGFTSRLGSKIRSDEGLTYSIYSNAESNYDYPGTFYIEFFTKNQSLLRAIYLTIEETKRLLKSGVTEDELNSAKSTLIGEIPSMFRSPFDIVSTYAWNEFFGRMPDHYKKYPEEIKKISRDDVQKAAQKYLAPEKMVFTIVGDTSALFQLKDSSFVIQNLIPQKSIDASLIPQLP